jgi:hypothetical protein
MIESKAWVVQSEQVPVISEGGNGYHQKAKLYARVFHFEAWQFFEVSPRACAPKPNPFSEPLPRLERRPEKDYTCQRFGNIRS